jgi:hypothetical protein
LHVDIAVELCQFADLAIVPSCKLLVKKLNRAASAGPGE